jgi:hypothetical protein
MKYKQDIAGYRVILKREIRRMSELPLYKEIRDAPTDRRSNR